MRESQLQKYHSSLFEIYAIFKVGQQYRTATPAKTNKQFKSI